MKTWMRPLMTGLTLLAAGAAQAHPGHGVQDLTQGLAHPFLGLDHLLAMLAVGVWSAVALPVGQRLLGPAAFLLSLLAGAMLALSQPALPGLEGAIAASMVLMGALLLWHQRTGVAAGLAALTGAGLLHGLAHGAEAGAGGLWMGYALGFLLSSALLHGLGLLAGQTLARVPAWVRQLTATLLAGSGGLMLLSRL